MDLRLTDKLAIVTGASSGIGLAITRAFLDEGARVVTGSRTVSPELSALVDTGRVDAVVVDLSTPDGPGELVSRAEALGGADILVNNVGALTPRTEGFLAVGDDDWMRTFQLGFFAAVRAIRAVIPGMQARGGGKVVTIGSVNAFLPDPFVVDYSAAKAAVWNLSKALSKEYGPDGIRFNTISPGPVATPLWLGEHGVAATVAAAQGTDFETAKRDVVAAQGGFSTGRFTEPSEVADLVLLLSSDRAGNTTGADFLIDGGLVKTL
ncbi:oxidoreductase [Cryocola sp. 340MFSha3.1]|uniref:oxidoreductase n=1 Tax=Cryocola sp. 340MFSha3.1 TaxID=1169145 RepID=UPI000369AF2E|nr:oxidoreductase [Cryocola sp. 340MFSha3.1]